MIGFRPDLPLAGVTEAVKAGVGPLAGAKVIADDHLVVSGTAGKGEQVWANEPAWDGVGRPAAGSTYAHRGCIPVRDALGSAADAEHLSAVDAAHRCTSWTTSRRSRLPSGTAWPRCGWARTGRTCSSGATSGGTGR